MTQREKFAEKYSSHSGVSVQFDAYGVPYIDTPYVTNVIPNAMVQAAYWGWQAAKAQAVPEGWKLVPVVPNHSMRRVMTQVINTSMPVMEMVETIYSAGIAAAPEVNKC